MKWVRDSHADSELITVAMARARTIPPTANRAQKRSRDDEEQDYVSEDHVFNPRTPNVSPENDTQVTGLASTNQLGNDQMDLENQMQEKSSGVPKVSTDSASTMAHEAKAKPAAPVKRQCLQTASPDDDDTDSEEVEPIPWEVLLGPGYGWTAIEKEGHEGDIFRYFTDIVTERFLLPPLVNWLAKNQKDGLMLARISKGICYFDSKLSRCWRLALTSSEAKRKCEGGVATKEACEELVLDCGPGQPNGGMKIWLYDSDKGLSPSPPIEWIGRDYMSWLDGVPRIHNQLPTPASDTRPSRMSSSGQFSGDISSDILPEVGSKLPQELASGDSFNLIEEMELD